MKTEPTQPQLSLEQLHPCPLCHGQGWKWATDPTGRTRVFEPELCRVCAGTGTVTYDPADTTIPY